MIIVSAALRTVRGAYTRTSTRLRRSTPGPTGGGPFLHWVPDRPDGARLAGEYVPIRLGSEPDATARRPRRRH